MAIAIFYSQELKEYDFGQGHPFSGQRFEVFSDFFRKKIPQENFQWLEPKSATDEKLRLVHSQEYIDFVEKFYQAIFLKKNLPPFSEIHRFLSPDNLPGPQVGRLNLAARLIVGAAIEAGELVWQGKFEKAICPGGLHHAKRSYGEGFCLFNDVAICAENLKRKFGLKKILILDTDAHAGNGTAEIFYQDNQVLFIDLHQDPKTLYPGTGFVEEIGQGKGRGYTVNLPLPPLANDQCYQLVFEEIIEPISQEFQPQIVIRNGGSDPHFSDSLTNLGLSIKGFKMIGEKVRKIAQICQGKEIDLIGSGYNLQILPLAWSALISGLTGKEIELKEPFPQKKEEVLVIEETRKMIEKVKISLKDYWSCFG